MSSNQLRQSSPAFHVNSWRASSTLTNGVAGEGGSAPSAPQRGQVGEGEFMLTSFACGIVLERGGMCLSVSLCVYVPGSLSLCLYVSLSVNLYVPLSLFMSVSVGLWSSPSQGEGGESWVAQIMVGSTWRNGAMSGAGKKGVKKKKGKRKGKKARQDHLLISGSGVASSGDANSPPDRKVWGRRFPSLCVSGGVAVES